jgi:hypothetical protein|tara:strand:+ start:129 stop:326 length:198 start_codon:yes stop_codon:yes gene_type:complete
MNLAEKVIGVALIGLMALISWNLISTINLQQEMLKMQHEQKHMHEQIDKRFNNVLNKLKKLKNKI